MKTHEHEAADWCGGGRDLRGGGDVLRFRKAKPERAAAHLLQFE